VQVAGNRRDNACDGWIGAADRLGSNDHNPGCVGPQHARRLTRRRASRAPAPKGAWGGTDGTQGETVRIWRNTMQTLRERLMVKPEDLRRRVDPATLPFQTTAEVAPVKTTIGQPRAAEAIAFALEVGARGFHLYAAGLPGTGRESTVLAA